MHGIFEKMMRKIASKTDISADDLLAEPTVILHGFGELSLDRHKAIEEYSEQRIVISFHRGRICVEGDGLELKQMLRDRLTVTGRILSLSFEGV